MISWFCLFNDTFVLSDNMYIIKHTEKNLKSINRNSDIFFPQITRSPWAFLGGCTPYPVDHQTSQSVVKSMAVSWCKQNMWSQWILWKAKLSNLMERQADQDGRTTRTTKTFMFLGPQEVREQNHSSSLIRVWRSSLSFSSATKASTGPCATNFKVKVDFKKGSSNPRPWISTKYS